MAMSNGPATNKKLQAMVRILLSIVRMQCHARDLKVAMQFCHLDRPILLLYHSASSCPWFLPSYTILNGRHMKPCAWIMVVGGPTERAGSPQQTSPCPRAHPYARYFNWSPS